MDEPEWLRRIPPAGTRQFTPPKRSRPLHEDTPGGIPDKVQRFADGTAKYQPTLPVEVFVARCAKLDVTQDPEIAAAAWRAARR